MITFTDVAKQKVQEYIEQSEAKCEGLRVMADRQGRHRLLLDWAGMHPIKTSYLLMKLQRAGREFQPEFALNIGN